MKKLSKVLLMLVVVLFGVVLVSCGEKEDTTGKGVYTLRSESSDLPTSWNSHTYQSNSSTLILDYAEDALYTFDFNENKDGYVIVEGMAAAMPVDVTSEFVALAAEDGTPTDASFGIGWQWVAATDEEYEATAEGNRRIRAAADAWVDKYGYSLEAYAEAYECASVEEFVTGVLGLESMDAFNAAWEKKQVKQFDTAKAYRITLRDDLKFDNGDAITAQTFAESVKALINPDANNYRADSLWSGNLKIVNAENYYKGGKYDTTTRMVSANYDEDEYQNPSTFVTAEDGHLQTADGKDLIINLNLLGNWSPSAEYGLIRYAQNGYMGQPADVRTYSTDGTRVKYADKTVNPTVEVWRSKDKDETAGDFIWYTSETGTETVEVALGSAAYYVVETNTDITWQACASYVGDFKALWDAQDEDGLVYLTAETLLAVQNCIAQIHGHDDAAAYAEECDEQGEAGNYAYVEFEEMAFLGGDFERIEFSKVGFIASEDGKSITVILTNELEGFYLKYALCTNFYLIHPETYHANESTSQGVYTNSYGTSVESYVGHGPYKLTYFLDGSAVKFEKNPYWYGYNKAENAGLYQATNISIKKVPEAATRLQDFLKGESDSYGLQKEDMEDYQSSDYTYFTDGDSTWFIAINPNFTALSTNEKTAEPVNQGYRVNKTVLTIKEFRQALSFSVDRAAYALALDPLGGTAKALYGTMIISDPDNGVAYRTTTQAKDVILKFWGLYDSVAECGATGEAVEYQTRDEAIASITGYDPAGAKTLFNEAYAIAVEQGYIDVTDDSWEVQIMIGQPGSGSSAYYTNGYELLKQVWTEAVEDTEFEDHITFKQSQPLGSTSFANYLRDNSVDILFGVGWTGSALDPYGLMEAYVKPSYQYDPAWDTSKVDLDIEIGGQVLRASVYDWGYTCLGGTSIDTHVVVDGEVTETVVKINGGTSCDAEVRLNILAAVEGAVLEQYDMIPINLDSSANLKGMKVEYGVEEYVFGVGRGGIKYMTFNFDDYEWAKFVKSQNGTLNYK